MDAGTASDPYTRAGRLDVPDGVRLHYQFNDRGRRGSVLIAPGWIENSFKYAELAEDLAARGYSVFVLDHRGQGMSSRLAANPHMSHVARFEDYVEDLAAFYNRIVLPRSDNGIVLLGHSLGGLIGTRLAARKPSGLRALVLSAPLFEVSGGRLPEAVMYWIVRVLVTLGRGERYVPGHKDWGEDALAFEDSALTHSQERFQAWREILLSNPRCRVGGVSNNWLKVVIEASRSVVPLAAEIDKPVLLLQAGLDQLVRPRRQDQFCRRARRCRLERFPDARHELLMEADGIRDRVLAAVFQFLDEAWAGSPSKYTGATMPPRA